MKRKLFWLLPVLAAGFFNKMGAQEYEHLTITSGLTADVIANGLGSSMLSTTQAVDNANFAFMAANFQATTSGIMPSYALPVSGLITSAVTPGLTYQLADYSANNSLRIATANTSGTLVFSNQVSAAKLYLLATSGSGTATITGTITFTDASTQALTSTVIPDWFFSNALPIAISGFGRINRANNVIENTLGNPRLYQLAINILPANQSKLIESISFTKTSTAEGVLNIFALTAEVICNTPAVPVALAQEVCSTSTVGDLVATGAAGASFNWYGSMSATTPLATTATVQAGTYYVSQSLNSCESERIPVVVTTTVVPVPVFDATQGFCAGALAGELSAEGEAESTVVWSATSGGTALSPATPLTSGNYYVWQVNNGCTSAIGTVTVTVSTAASVTVDVSQDFCAGATVADLEAEGTTGNMIQWSLTNGGTVLTPTTLLQSGTYFVSQMNDDCSGAWTEVSVNVSATIPAVVTNTSQAVCNGATISNLMGNPTTGNTLTWSLSEGGAVLTPETVVTSGTYYVSQFNGDCSGPVTAVTVAVNDIPPAPTGSETQQFNTGETIADLEIITETGSSVNWFMTNDAGEMVSINSETELQDGEIYHVQQVLNGCASQFLSILVQEVLGTSNFAAGGYKVYPNPVNDVLTVLSDEAIATLDVYNLLGQSMLNVKTERTTVRVRVSDLAAGTYVLQVTTVSGIQSSKKIVKK